MHAVNSVWVGRTFALAKGNESVGRKARIRRSKEERKGMVESFIKKYQHLNNGNFPSLNLTHKEVGGSFYTVREIVREIIQENRVLGPAKFLPEEQSIDLLLEQYPVGTMSTEPQTLLSRLPNGSPFVADQPEHTREELDLVSADPEQQGFDNREIAAGNHVPSGRISIAHDQHEESALVCAESEQVEFGNREVINGSHVLANNAESDEANIGELHGRESLETEESVEVAASSKLKTVDVQANEVLETEKSVEEVAASETPTIVEVHVSASQETENNVAASAGKTLEVQASKPLETENNVAASAGKTLEVQASKPLETEKSVNKVATSQVRVSQIADVVVETFPIRPFTQTTDFCDGKPGEAWYLNGNSAEKDVEKVHSGAGNGSSLPDGVVISETSSLVDEKEEEKPLSPLPMSSSIITNGGIMRDVDMKQILETKVVNAPNGSIGSAKSTIQVDGVGKKTEVQNSSDPQKAGNPTLNRINLQSWEGARRRPSEVETNPLLVFFKSFVSAFMKFWSE